MKSASNQLLATTLRRMIRAGDTAHLKNVIERTHPADLAHVMRSLSGDQRVGLFNSIDDDEIASDVLSETDPEFLGQLIDGMSDERLERLVERMPSDDAADILQWIDFERKERLLGNMSLENQSEAEVMLAYHPESAGGLMSTDFFSVNEGVTAGEAIGLLQSTDDQPEVIFYLYVTNDHGQLVGVVSLRELVRVKHSTPIETFMIPEVIRIQVDTDQEEVARLVARYNLLALPVIENNNQLVGVVTVDDIIDVIRSEATEDIMLMAGAGEEASPHQTAWQSYRSRLPWIIPSTIAGLVGMMVIWWFEVEIRRVLPLVVMIPMVMGIAGNVGNQSATIVTRWLAVGRLDFSQLWRIVGREFFVGIAIGSTIGVMIAVLSAWVFADAFKVSGTELTFGITIGVSIVVAAAVAAAFGAATPLVFSRLNLDPALAKGPFVITSIDVLAVWIYFYTASLLL